MDQIYQLKVAESRHWWLEGSSAPPWRVHGLRFRASGELRVANASIKDKDGMFTKMISIIFKGLENECRQGKTDPKQRRRIQNRINQRTCRTKRRALAGCSNSERYDDSTIDEDDSLTSETSSTNNDPGQVSCLRPNPASFSTPFEGTMDELGLVINQNFRDAIRANLTSQGDDSEHVSKLQLNELSQGFTNPYPVLAAIQHQ
ncbi:hypothetical protein PRZ48_002220 [Zasmidium cellare]|uniref:BZIP domain-containing protein n=1 Tax=Zasmidium cellare TaxID=395010 RepID=A0ABR0F5A2_ZASCE|nr:hypothetical protein PRZ48_002220 [Zasmidium cellare]